MSLRTPSSWAAYWKQLRSVLLDPHVDEAALRESLREARSRMPVPVLWLLGKTQAGKTSIIRALTGSEAAVIGNGFQPCTRSSRIFDFPTEAPIVQFLDTRGLGERAYDPDEDVRFCESRAHLLVVVMKVADAEQQEVFDVLHAVRRRHPDWPLLIVHTALHERYPPGMGHLLPWPYDEDPLPDAVPVDLRRSLWKQREMLERIPGSGPVRSVAIDLTLPEDGYAPIDYGLPALWDAIESLAPLGLRQQLVGDAGVREVYVRAAHPHIVGYATVAAGLGAMPVVDLVAVTAVQAKLLHTLARLFGQCWDRRMVAEFFGLLGAGIAGSYLGRMLGRTVAKVIPFWGQTVGAAWGASSSGAMTYALGKAAVYYFSRRRDGLKVDADALRSIYADGLAHGTEILAERFRGKGG